MDRWLSVVWIALIAAVVALLAVPAGREAFEAATKAHPYPMGIAKIALLGTMGELLGGKIVTGKWRLGGIRLWQRVLVWALLGVMFTAVFPLFSFGVDGLLDKGLLPGKGIVLVTAFWKSFFMNMIFAFPMMVLHRITDTLIDRNQLFSSWPLVEVFVGIDWRNMFRVVGAACIWFWIPAHTLTFVLPPEYRVMSAALLAIVLGMILGIAKKRARAAQAGGAA
ncbi:MAG: hypothetical protein HY898_04270 [Deltaproteobacteria bacterium]|nr:hypothetical protein [Deltaproteobacteria bacterium]